MNVDWKKPTLFGAAFGIAAVLTAFAIIGAWDWYRLRPKSWDSNAIKCVSATASQTSEFDEANRTSNGVGFVFEFVLENTTNKDYTVPGSLKLFQREGASSALDEFNGRIEHPFVIPTKERAAVRIDVEYRCGITELETGVVTERDPQTCFKDAFGNITGFVGFDYDTRVRLNLLKPSLANGSSKPGNSTMYPAPDKSDFLDGATLVQSPGNSTMYPAPDKGDIFDQLDSCNRADRIVNSCRKQNIRNINSMAQIGGFETPLPDLPRPPANYELKPSRSTCEIAFEWQNYCRLKRRRSND